MGQRGPAPKPTVLKILEGNPGKRALPKNEPKPDVEGLPACPAWLGRDGKREWKRIVPELQKLGLLTCVDYAALASYCQSWDELVACARTIKEKGRTFKTPSGYVAQRPEVAMARAAKSMIRAFCHEFGLTPSARSRMSLPGDSDDGDESLDSLLA